MELKERPFIIKQLVENASEAYDQAA